MPKSIICCTMILPAFSIYAWAAGSNNPNPAEQAGIIQAVRDYALNYTKSLPNFLCTLKTQHVSRPPNAVNNPALAMTSTVIEERLSFVDNREIREIVKVEGDQPDSVRDQSRRASSERCSSPSSIQPREPSCSGAAGRRSKVIRWMSSPIKFRNRAATSWRNLPARCRFLSRDWSTPIVKPTPSCGSKRSAPQSRSPPNTGLWSSSWTTALRRSQAANTFSPRISC